MDDSNDNHSLLEKLKSPQKESGDDDGGGDDRWLEISVLEQRLAGPLVSTEKHQSSVIVVVTSFFRLWEVWCKRLYDEILGNKQKFTEGDGDGNTKKKTETGQEDTGQITPQTHKDKGQPQRQRTKKERTGKEMKEETLNQIALESCNVGWVVGVAALSLSFPFKLDGVRRVGGRHERKWKSS